MPGQSPPARHHAATRRIRSSLQKPGGSDSRHYCGDAPNNRSRSTFKTRWPMVTDPFNLQRFVDAQAPVYARVQTELARGLKTSHWIWFVFPQLAALGRSATAKHFGITSLAEAQAYWQHALLHERLVDCTSRVLAVRGKS